MLEILFLSIIQGITEFLPISSSAHLILFSKFFFIKNDNLIIDISLHLGSLLAIIYYFNKEINNFIVNRKLFFLIIISSLPTILIGYFLVKFNLINIFRNIEIISWTTLVFGLLLYFADLKSEKHIIKKNFNIKTALIIGLFQILSLIPGVSRSGITITAARLLNFKRIESAKISFLLSIPTLAIISLYNIGEIINANNYTITIESYFSVLLSFIFSYLTVKYFIEYLKKFSLIFFVIYRVILALIIFIYVYI